MRSATTARRPGQGRLTAATLLASLFLLLAQAFFVAPALADAALPACCRNHGKHFGQCSGQHQAPTGFTTVQEKCPYAPLAPSSVHTPSFALSVSSNLLSVPVAGSTHRIQQALWSTLPAEHSHPKRGPPSAIILL